MRAPYEHDEGAPQPATSARIAVVIPTLNEADSIGAVVGAIPRDLVNRIIVADGQSSDGTAARAADAGADVIRGGRGYGRACLAGVDAAADADIIVFMDGDGADDPSRIAALVEPIRSGAHDFVIGSRVRGEREPGSIAWHQIVAGQLAGLAMRALYGARYTDMCAFRAIRRDRLMGLRHARDDLRVERRNADAGSARAAAHPGNSGSVPTPHRRDIEGLRQRVGHAARRDPHRLHDCSHCQ